MQAVEEAWASACGSTGNPTIIIPKGDFLTGALNFTGPCKGDGLNIKLEGNLLASNDLAKFKSNWIEIMRVKKLSITGKGNIAGQGKADPTATILSVAMLLDHLGRTDEAARVEAAVAADLAGRGHEVRTTSAIGDAVAARLS